MNRMDLRDDPITSITDAKCDLSSAYGFPVPACPGKETEGFSLDGLDGPFRKVRC